MADLWPTPPAVVPVVLAILNAATPSIEGSDEIPDPRPSQFYVVSRVGGNYRNPAVDEPRVLIECWAETSSDAESMALTAVAAMKNAPGSEHADVFVHGVDDVQGPVDFNDPRVPDRRRCQFHCSVATSTDPTGS